VEERKVPSMEKRSRENTEQRLRSEISVRGEVAVMAEAEEA
jgi:hypothetical protein